MNTFKGKIVLESAKQWKGLLWGATNLEHTPVAELVFNTSMTGYQEILTDPSYNQQHITFTYPLIGNYGISREFQESEKIQCSGVIVKSWCEGPQHFRSHMTIDQYLKENHILGISDVDTRSITQFIRDNGPMKAVIAHESVDSDELIHMMKQTKLEHHVKNVTQELRLLSSQPQQFNDKPVVLWDFGHKKGIYEKIQEHGLSCARVNYDASADEILGHNPIGIIMSNGPGDPSQLSPIIDKQLTTVLQSKVPVFGICLGMQLICLNLGAHSSKLPFGHRGANHPVKNHMNQRVSLTSQNHGYQIDHKSLPRDLKVWFSNINDQSLEGVYHETLPIMAVQFHPEYRPGPVETAQLFPLFFTYINELNRGGKNESFSYWLRSYSDRPSCRV